MTAETTGAFTDERLLVATLRERPELREQAFSSAFGAAVPEFMRHDATAALYYADSALDRYVDFVLAAVDRDEPGRVIARAVSVPIAFRDGTPGRVQLPDGGWDAAIRWADADWRAGRRATCVSALEIIVLPPYRGRGVSQLMLKAMIANTWARGFGDLYAPLRPSDKHLEPHTPFADYVARLRPTGCRTIPGCARISGSAAASSRSPRAAWSSPARSPSGRNGPVSGFTRPAMSSYRAPCPPCMCRSSTITPSISSPICGCTTASDTRPS